MFVAIAALLISSGQACTNFVVTRGASADQSTLFGNTADEGGLHGPLPHFPAGSHAPGTRRKLYDTDTGRLLGDIEEASETFNVIGNLNEYGVAIGETKFGGNASLAGGEGVMDYGNLIWVTLQRTKTAFQAVEMFGTLVEQYGYISAGVSFTIADPGEAWVLEMVGKGQVEKGAVWVARRVPEGHISGHASQARIQNFPMDVPSDCVYSKDVISFAAKLGLWDFSMPQERFSFAAVYDPIALRTAQQSDLRIWSFFALVADDTSLTEAYYKQVAFGGGHGAAARARLPFSVRPRRKLAVLDLMKHMRNHYNGTDLYEAPAIGMLDAAELDASAAPRRRWQFQNGTFAHTRTTGSQSGGWNFVAQLRGHFPAPIGGLLWFGIDDATFTVHMPIHGGATRVPRAFTEADDTFWAFNAAAQFINPRWSLAPAVLARAHALEEASQEALLQEDWRAWRLFQASPAKAQAYLTQQEEARAQQMTQAQLELLRGLMARFQRQRSPGAGALRGAAVSAGLGRGGRSEEDRAEELAELKKWFSQMAHQAARPAAASESLSLWAAPSEGAGRPLEAVWTLSAGGACILVAAAVALLMVRLRRASSSSPPLMDSDETSWALVPHELWSIEEEEDIE